MKATLKTVLGENKSQIDLPSQFNEEIRPDLIKRAALVVQSNKIQPRGADPEAGQKYSSKISRRRRDYKGAYGHGISRVPRKILSYRGTRFNWQAATAPNTVGGRQAHPPKAERVWSRKINKKERRKAIRSALAATVDKMSVELRGHIVSEGYPFVLESKIESISKTKEVIDLLIKMGFEKELERASKKTENTGTARRRGRKFKKRVGPLFVVSKKCKLSDAAVNIPGVDVVNVKDLNADLLAPGTVPGRLTFYSEAALKMMEEKKLFTDNPVADEK